MTETKTRRRGKRLEQAILDAAWAELKEVGYAGFSIEAVAGRAATSKPVIYRRWPNRAELVLAAWRCNMPATPETPDTGDLRSDLLAMFHLAAHRANTMMSEVIAGVMGEAFRHPEVIAALREHLTRSSPATEAMETIVRRAADRGELPFSDLPLRAARLPFELVRIELMTGRSPLSEEAVVGLVDEIYLPLLRGLATASAPATR
ncbi:MAG TPA: TetR/AcrR family transcriptional regulator [Amycolatopsis sp.]|nr:TetR/AcrR family transcriptional regulator [Amycolatopsis sp.]